MLNNPEDMLGILLRGVLGRSGRKRARRASRYLTGRGGFLTASTLMAAAGVAWGIYDSLKAGSTGAPDTLGASGTAGALGSAPPPLGEEALPDAVLRLVRLAVSAARADGTLAPEERALILARAREAEIEAVVEAELAQTRPLADIVAGVTDASSRRELYVLAFTIVRADESVSGAERIYLAQLAHQLGLDAPVVAEIEAETMRQIDRAGEGDPQPRTEEPHRAPNA